ncbi:MAG: prepilin peptidase, partial [Thermoplasmatales archaeon]
GIIILGYASYTDIKTRRASNILWIIMGSFGAILLIIQYFTVKFENPMYLLFIPVMIGLMYAFFQMRLIFGGADAKALMALTILVPLSPTISEYPLWPSLMPFPWVILANSVIIFLFIPLSLLIFNIFKKNMNFPYCVLGYRMGIQKAREKFVWPLEKIVDGKRKFVRVPKDFDIEEELKEFEKKGINEIWVTPKIPFMIPLLVGFICSFIVGDILFHLMNLIMY